MIGLIRISTGQAFHELTDSPGLYSSAQVTALALPPLESLTLVSHYPSFYTAVT